MKGLIAVPLKDPLCGEPAALSAMLTVAVRLPTACGWKVTVTAHCAPAFRLVPQLFVCEKSPGFGPAKVTLEIVSGALPLLLSTKVCFAPEPPTFVWGKVRLAGFSVAVGAGTGAVPGRLADWGV